MITIRIQLIPVGHYFLGGERGFAFDPKLKRQMIAGYFIHSLKVPSQTTLFGTLRYIIGVKNERLREDSVKIIGAHSFNIVGDENDYGIITNISPLYLHKNNSGRSREEIASQPDGYYIRTPFDHKSGNNTYHPLKLNPNGNMEVINFPDEKSVAKTYPYDYCAKDGISKSYTCISSSKYQIVDESDIFTSSVEVVSRKAKMTNNNQDGFAKKEYFRLNPGWSFVFFAELDDEKHQDISIEYNNSIVLGKDSSVFLVHVSEEKEPEFKGLFRERGEDFHYFQSPAYIKGNTSDLIGKASFSILDIETHRRFKTEHNRLVPEYGASLVQLICAGSIVYSDNIEGLIDDHAAIAGFNRIVNGGRR